MMVVVLMPLLDAWRFSLRGILISRGRTRAITVTNVVALLFITSAISFAAFPSRDNGALNAYVIWFLALVIDIAILWRFARRPHGPADLPPPVPVPREATGG